MTREDLDFIGSMNMCDEISDDAYKKIVCHCEEQEPKVWNLDDARDDFTSDVYNTLDFLPTNNEANRIIDSFDRVTSGIKQESTIDKIRAEIEQVKSIMNEEIINHDRKDLINFINGLNQSLMIIDKYKE